MSNIGEILKMMRKSTGFYKSLRNFLKFTSTKKNENMEEFSQSKIKSEISQESSI